MDRRVKKAFLIGLGVSLLTKDKVEQEVHKYMRRYRVSEKDSKRLAKRIIADSMAHKKDIESKISTAERELARHARELSALAKEFVPEKPKKRRQ